ncbi:SRPBCC family protein [Daejeonella lutea]|uniref:Activator of Hsp90 ATPase homolog 1-like protein n=1 Tax=Daejeonella lutea TaxID=572036 RepID=A0A1T5BLH1_9SPHI|nr:SRPBCC domain-containing protein [Daejeonella lutea]SKB48068.1 Activator of Hsp90 ATPase homolog 1-like protein [Daejeonella lutea]
MEKLKFTKEINAPAQKVWKALWNEESYARWTESFNPNGTGSAMTSDWQVGGRTIFSDKEGNGMISTIKSMNEPTDVVFQHLGEIIKGVEDTTSEKVLNWAGSLESYHLTENNGTTTLTVQVETLKEWEKMMTDGFGKGLEIVKEISERVDG